MASFCAIQIAIANSIGMRLGHSVHMATSMHYYLAGPMGEWPPNIRAYDEEMWYRCPPKMPTSYCGDIACTQVHAEALLSAMYEHFVVENKPGREFKCNEARPW